VRSLLDLIRRTPGHVECFALDETDIGNGMAGGNTRCGCRAPAHETQAGR
jgi:hypothetical protein